MKKTILYIIDSLERGGAEVMLVASLKEVHYHYNIIIVTLKPGNAFTENELSHDKIYCLNMQGKKNILQSVRKLKRIIKENKVHIVHATLYWSVIISRLACSKKIRQVFSLATIMTAGIYRHKWYSVYTRLLDMLTYKKEQAIVSPSQEALDDFDNSIGIKGRKKVLYNFVNDDFFKNEINYEMLPGELKLVAVGNLKDVKNYQLMINAFKLLQNKNVSLHIYGEGPYRDSLQKQIDEFQLPIQLMGVHEKIFEILPRYDVFVMCSLLEGFGISAAEAMTIGLPLLLSDIKTLHEVSQGNALFFDPRNAQSFADIVTNILNNKIDLKKFSDKGKLIAKENYTKEKYINGLLNFYNELEGQPSNS